MVQHKLPILKNLANVSGEKLAPSIINRSFRHIIRIEQAFEIPRSENLRNLISLRGNDFVEGILQLWLLDLMQFFYANTPAKMMSENQIVDTCSMILDTYGTGSLNMGDIKLFFSFIKKGEFGKIYGVLNPPQVLEWLRVYLDKRMDLAAARNATRSRQTPSYLDLAPRLSDSKTNKQIMSELQWKYSLDMAKHRTDQIKKKMNAK